MKKPIIYAVIGVGIVAVLVFASAQSLFSSASSNHPPQVIVTPGKQFLAGSKVALAADKVFDEDGDSFTFHWTQMSGEQVILSDSEASNPTFSIAPSEFNRTLTFQVEVSDGKATNPSVVKVTIVANKPPRADAGKDLTVNSREQTVLDSSKSTDPESQILTYKWLQTGGPKVEISNSNAPEPTFVAPFVSSKQTLTFQLIVNDGIVDSKPDIVKVAVGPIKPLVANAGPDQNVTGQAQVTLDGSKSTTPNGEKLTYWWNQTAGPKVMLSDLSASNPTFVAPISKSAKVLTFQLFVNDGAMDSKPDSVKITIQANKAPVAEAGTDFTVGIGDQATLNATGSYDPDGNSLTYRWNQTAGPLAELSDTKAAKPTFQAPILEDAARKVLTFQLVVSDGIYDAKPDYVKVTVLGNMPVANAGPDRNVTGNAKVTLDGSKSTDPEADKLTYKWSQTAGPKVKLSDTKAAKPTFKSPPKGDKDKVMTFQLIVSDNKTDSKPDTVTLTVTANRPPIANAGPDQTYKGRDNVVLNGTASSDPDGQKLTYEWKKISGPPVSLKYAKQDQAVFKAPSTNSKQVLTFQLTVSDGVLSSTDFVQITIRAS